MPTRPAPHVNRPYVGRIYDSDGLVRIADLGRENSRMRSLAELRRGESSARTWRDVGQAVSDGLRGIRQDREQAPIRAAQAERAAFEQRQMGRADKAATDAEAARAQEAADAKRLQDLMAANGGQPPSPDVLVREFGLEGGLAFKKLFDEMAPPTPARIPTREIKTRRSDGSESIQIVEDKPGGAFTSVPEPAKLTFSAPTAAMLGGRRVFVRSGSDGKTYDMSGRVVETEPTPIVPPVSGGGDDDPLVQIMGPDGKAVYVRRRDAIGKTPPAGSEKASSGVQKRVLNFFNRAAQADVDIEGMETAIQGQSLAGQAWQQYAPNFVQTELGQKYTQAQRAFTEARLRKDSGAAIPNHEFEIDRKTYFAQPGDSEETLAQKRRGRAAVLASLAFESGQALGEFIGSADEAAAIIENYKARSKDPKAPLKPGTTMPVGGGLPAGIAVTTPDGQVFTFQSKAQADAFKKRAGLK